MRIYYYLLCFILAAIAGSCSKDDSSKGASLFSIEEAYLQQDFENKQTSVSLPVNTNLESSEWSVESNESWCLVTKEFSNSNASIKILVYASEEVDTRAATITVKSPVKNYSIQVRQLGYGPAILVKDAISVESEGGTLKVLVTSNIEYTITQTDNTPWLTSAPHTRALTDKEYSYQLAANPTYQDRSTTLKYTYKADEKVTATCVITQKAKKSSISDVEVEGDIQLKPTDGKASEAQSGSDIDKSFDGKMDDACYHSIWNQSAAFPVTLEYFFDGKQDLDYILYHTRSGNGNFGELDIYTATEEAPQYKLQGSYDFQMQNAASRVDFATQLKKVTKVKFAIKSGLGDFVSCSEMEFYKKNDSKKLDAQLLTVFKDITCSELKEAVTDAQINTLPGYFAHIAVQLKNNTYDEWEKKFRIHEYEPYSNVEEWAEKLMTKRYGNLDNPTGIYANANDSIIVLVGDTHGQKVTLQSITGIEPSGDTYFLNEGVNKIGIRNTGMLFIMYTANLADSNAKPIRIHIPLNSGTVNGFFDLKVDKTDEKYASLLSRASYKYFCVRGEKIIFYFHLSKMREFVPTKILSAINLWDNIIGWQQELMGIDDVRPSQVNNHIFAISPEDSYMWASDYRIGFVYTYLNNILLYDNVMAAKDNAWGPAHEIGHIHQIAINWPSSTESSNNLFSNYTLYKLGKYCSRGSELSALATARCVNGDAWYNMGQATHQNEDTELHMRMNWQLWNYYHRCGYKPDFWQKLFKLLRENRITESNPGAGQLIFAKMACQAANENLTDFFERWGFFEPVNNATIEQYGNWKYNVTSAMISEAKAYMAKFPAAKHAFYYLEDRKNGDVGIENYKVGDVGHYSQFKSNQKITKTPTYIRSGQNISINNGEEAVAFEVTKGDRVLFFSNFLTFDIPSSITLEGASIYAIQADGERKLVKVK